MREAVTTHFQVFGEKWPLESNLGPSAPQTNALLFRNCNKTHKKCIKWCTKGVEILFSCSSKKKFGLEHEMLKPSTF